MQNIVIDRDRFPNNFEHDPKPTILIDSRERQRLVFTRLAFEVRGLPTSDYSIRGLETQFAIERKSVPDLVACCGPECPRFESELVRMRGYDFRRLLIVGSPEEIDGTKYRSRIAPRAVWATLHAFEARYNLPVVFEPTPEAAAARVEVWAVWFWREKLKELAAITKAAGPARHLEGDSVP